MKIIGRINSFVCYLALLVLIGQLVGCGKPVSYGAVRFVTEPAGAEVVNLRDDTNLGSTPLEVVWESEDGKPEHVTVQFRKRGYMEKIVSLWVNKRHDSREAASMQPQPVRIELEERR